MEWETAINEKESQIILTKLSGITEVLIEKTRNETEESLISKITNDFVVIDDAFNTEILESFSSKEVGDVLSDFSFTVRGKSSTVSFKVEDINNLIENIILSEIPNEDVVYPKKMNVNYRLESVDWNNGELKLDFDLDLETYTKIDLDFLKKELMGRSSSETKFLLENQVEIIKSEIDIWPFWVSNIPDDKDMIKINYPFID
jgi:hypothetical protein